MVTASTKIMPKIHFSFVRCCSERRVSLLRNVTVKIRQHSDAKINAALYVLREFPILIAVFGAGMFRKIAGSAMKCEGQLG
jgi:hypothetical protein